MQTTGNLGLKKPEGTDVVDIADFNENSDILDVEVTRLATAAQAGRMSAADKAKLDGIEAGAQVNAVTSVAGKTGAVVLAKGDVGLGNVQNFGVATQAEAEDGTSASKYMTPQRTAQAIAVKAQPLVEAVQGNLDAHITDYVRQPGYAADTGAANAKVVTLNPAPATLTDGFAVSFKNAVQNTGAATLNVNGLGAKAILKANGTALSGGNLKAGSIYTVRYNATTGNFILQGEGGSGNAQPAEVLSGRTFTNDAGDQVGTMTNYSGQTPTVAWHNHDYELSVDPNDNRMGYIKIPNAQGGGITGYVNPTTKFNVQLWGLLPENIAAGKYIGQYAGYGSGQMYGTFTSDANAGASHILSGFSAYVNGAKVNGTMPNYGTGGYATDAISASGTQLRYSIPNTGRYDTAGYIYFNEPNWVEDKIKAGETMFGKTGTLKVPNFTGNMDFFPINRNMTYFDGTKFWHIQAANEGRVTNFQGTVLQTINTANWRSEDHRLSFWSPGNVFLTINGASGSRQTHMWYHNESGTLIKWIFEISSADGFLTGSKVGYNGTYVYYPKYNTGDNTHTLRIINLNGTLIATGMTTSWRMNFWLNLFNTIGVKLDTQGDSLTVYTDDAKTTVKSSRDYYFLYHK